MQDILGMFRAGLEVVNETSTQVTFVCPVCLGKNLKMNKYTKAYCCFSAGCSSTDIRRELGLFCKGYTEEHSKLVFPVEVKAENVVFPDTSFARPSIQVFYYKKYSSKASKVIYDYSATLRVVRVKIWENNEKFFFPEMLDSNNQWVSCRGQHIKFPFYNTRYVPADYNKTLLVAEGEKCAAQLTQDFALTLSPVGYGSNSEKYLSDAIHNFQYSVKNVLYFPDGDKAGKHKAQLFQRLCWEKSLPCSVLNLGFTGTTDIYDWLTANSRTKTEIREFILGGLNGV